MLVNPAARQTRDRAAIERAVDILRRRYRVDVLVPHSGQAIESAARQAAGTHDALVVAGGDGTLNRAVNALRGIPVRVGMLPLGTGNDFARAVGIPTCPTAAAEQMLDGRVRLLDLVSVNERLFTTVGVLGLGANSALTIARLSAVGSRTRPLVHWLGGLSYRLVSLGHLLLQPRVVEQIGVRSAQGAEMFPPMATHAVFVTNMRVLGGGLSLPVDVDPTDGQLEIIVVSEMSRARLLWAFICFAQGWRVPDGVLQVLRVRDAHITSGRCLPFAADGEFLCEGTTFAVSVHPAALAVLC